MDSNFLSPEKISSLFESSRIRAFAIAFLILAALVLLQAGNLKRPVTMCKLFEQCSASDEDLQRMQLAFGKSGLNEFKVVDGKLMVPKSEHSIYLQSLLKTTTCPTTIRFSLALNSFRWKKRRRSGRFATWWSDSRLSSKPGLKWTKPIPARHSNDLNSQQSSPFGLQLKSPSTRITLIPSSE